MMTKSVTAWAIKNPHGDIIGISLHKDNAWTEAQYDIPDNILLHQRCCVGHGHAKYRRVDCMCNVEKNGYKAIKVTVSSLEEDT